MEMDDCETWSERYIRLERLECSCAVVKLVEKIVQL